MHSFEERWNRAADGTLDAAAADAFARECHERGEPVPSPSLGTLLRERGCAPPMPHSDFFESEILRQIASPPAPPREPGSLPSLWKWLAPGFGAIAAAALVAFFAIPHTPRTVTDAAVFVAQILETRPGDGIEAYAFQPGPGQASVIWLEGMEYIPPEASAR